MYRFLLILTAILFVKNGEAQSAEDSIKAAINTLFSAMNKSDAEQLKNAFSPTAVLQTIGKSAEGKMLVKEDKVADFAAAISQAKVGALDERIQFGSIHIDGPLASVWTPYQFYYEGKLSHCGVNSFQLVRLDGVWKIQYIIDTRRKTGCE